MIKPNRPHMFQCKLINCGSDTFNANYTIQKDKSALQLLIRLINSMCDDMVGRNNAVDLRFDLAIVILRGTAGWDLDELKQKTDSPDTIKQLISKWELKQ